MIRQGILVFEDSATPDQMRRRFGGLTLLDRGIRTMARAGLKRILVIVPRAAAGPIEVSRITGKLDIELEIVPRGAEVDMRFPAGEDTLVLAGDFVHHHTSLSEAIESGLGAAELVVLAGESLQGLALDEVAQNGDALRFRETAEPRHPVSSGVFLCAAALAPQELAATTADVWTFFSVRAAGRRVEINTPENDLWRRVVDRHSARDAKNMLFSQVTKKTSGPVSRHLNARLSIPISKILVETGISPHMVTVLFVMTTGLTSAYLFSRPDDYALLALAGVLWQLAAVLDRCDGEVARVKLCESKFGAWFDTVTDNIAYMAMLIGMQIGMLRLHPGEMLYHYVGLSALGAMLFSLALLWRYAIKTGTGSLQHYNVGLRRHVPESQKSAVYKFVENHSYAVKRDFFAFCQFVFLLADLFEQMYWLMALGLYGLAFGIVLSQRKMLAGHRAQAVRSSSPALETRPVVQDRV